MANQVARNLQKLVDIKKDIKSALEEKNRAPTNEFSTYANEIRSLITGGATISSECKEAVKPTKKYDTLHFDTSLTNEEVENIEEVRELIKDLKDILKEVE